MFLVKFVTETETPTPPPLMPMPKAPAMIKPEESSEAFTATVPPANTLALLPILAVTVFLKVLTATEPPTPTMLPPPTPTATLTMRSALRANTFTSAKATTCADDPMVASVVCLTKAI